MSFFAHLAGALLVSPLFWLIVAFIVSYYIGKARALRVVNGNSRDLHSLPGFHGSYLGLWTALPGILVLTVFTIAFPQLLNSALAREFADTFSLLPELQQQAFLRDANAIASGGISSSSDEVRLAAGAYAASFRATANWVLAGGLLLLAGAGFAYAYNQISAAKRTRHVVERVSMGALIAASAVAILTTVGIVFSLVFESYLFFQKVPIFDFLFGLHWSPQSAYEPAGASAAELAEAASRNSEVFGAIPLLAGTFLITLIAISVAAPIGLLSAVYLSDYASQRVRALAKPVLEILAGIPTVVYGFFAALTVAPYIRDTFDWLSIFTESWFGFVIPASSESALAAGVVMGIMIIPFISSLSDDVINAVPQSLRDGSAGLGATKSETILKVVLPAALPGIVSALILAISRAVGETMIVVMAAGLAANLTFNPLDAVTTVTVQIVTLLVGDQEFDSAKTLAAFALGLLLFCVTLALNVFALRVVQKYREQYD
ncbi:MAG: phosphate ABC transporter permease subunit PstC [Rhizobiales bacterium]|nr:phosphate ABC transporter permease subunit PstC [Hyphomicrobiales bacterium]